MQSITPAELQFKIANREMFALKFWAPWCQPCHQFSPVVDKVHQQIPVPYYSVNVEEFPDIAAQFEVKSIPTVVGIKKGDLNFRTIGAVDYKDLFVKTQMMALLP